jgi:branched-chain amino acid transport system substrate-binding protein
MRPSVLLILGCVLTALWQVPAHGADSAPIDIDVILSMSGTAAFVGRTDYDALSILENAVNKQGGIRGRPLHFVFHDDKTDPQLTLQLFNGILAEHPSIFLGPSNVAPCRAIMPLVANGPVDFCLTPALHPPSGSYVFSSSVSTRDCVAALVRYFRERGWKRIGVLSVTDAGGQDADTNLAAVMSLPENKGVGIVAYEHFNPGDVSVTAQLVRIKAADPQAVILWASGTPFATLLRGAAEIGLNVPIGASNADMNYLQMKQYAAFLPRELLFPGLPFLAGEAPDKAARDVQRQFFDAFASAGIRPDFVYSTSWDPALIVVGALRALGPGATPDQLRAYIAHLHGFTGVSGAYDFRDGSQRGLTDKNVMVMRWNGERSTWTAVSGLGGTPLPAQPRE